MNVLLLRTLGAVIVAATHVLFANISMKPKYASKFNILIWTLYFFLFVFVAVYSNLSMAYSYIINFILYLYFYLVFTKGEVINKLFLMSTYLIIFTFLYGAFRAFLVSNHASFFIVGLVSVIYILLMLTFILYLIPKFNRNSSKLNHGWFKLYSLNALFFILLILQAIYPKILTFDDPIDLGIFVVSGACYMVCFDLMFSNVKTINNVNEQLNKNKVLENLAYLDTLTGLGNKLAFDTYIDYLKSNYKEDDDIKIIMLDADKFKQINDNYGHQTGDNVLKEIGENLKASFSSNYHLFRTGGDEFVVVGLDVSEEDIISSVTHLNEQLKALNGLRMSYGFTKVMTNSNEDNPFSIALKKADKKMYEDKFTR